MKPDSISDYSKQWWIDPSSVVNPAWKPTISPFSIVADTRTGALSTALTFDDPSPSVWANVSFDGSVSPSTSTVRDPDHDNSLYTFHIDHNTPGKLICKIDSPKRAGDGDGGSWTAQDHP
jgi:hypothetical protein